MKRKEKEGKTGS